MSRRVLALALVGPLALAVPLALIPLLGGSSVHAADTPRWNRDAAARYLDRRMDDWWLNAKSLKTAAGDTRCLSCHTAVPYAWARQALRQAQAVAQPTAHETRILEQVTRRVGYRADDQPYYDHTEAKQIESRGVEAILNAVVLTSVDVAAGPRERQPLVAAAMQRMWEVQRPDGRWDWLDFGLEPYEAPDAAFQGATMAAMAAGSTAGRQASTSQAARSGLERLRGYLRAQSASQHAFNKAWLLLAAARLEGLLSPGERDAIATELESRQRADGGWSLADLGVWRWGRQEAPFAPPGATDASLLGTSDGYATGLVVYALRQSGREVSRPSIRRGQQWLIDHQVAERAGDAAWAPWRAHSLNFDREHGGPKGEPWRRMFMSDLATAFSVLALS